MSCAPVLKFENFWQSLLQCMDADAQKRAEKQREFDSRIWEGMSKYRSVWDIPYYYTVFKPKTMHRCSASGAKAPYVRTR